MISDRALDQITEELSLRNGGASVCVHGRCTLTGARDLTVRGVGTFTLGDEGTLRPAREYGISLYDRDWEPEEARG